MAGGFRSLAPKTKNLVVAGGLTAFVFGVYFYTMRAVGGTDELQMAIDKFEAQKGKKDAESSAYQYTLVQLGGAAQFARNSLHEFPQLRPDEKLPLGRLFPKFWPTRDYSKIRFSSKYCPENNLSIPY
ncbi:hypothetical protein L484_020386 [Morus notabilis]|uniref:Cytochrome c oxidase assembly factor 3 mitochondrial coiled-coil domain-containing protein n=1 Tax=Morus notabilis TaxID=981085 RepID=W9RFF6_9ROSA|nr:hypothetical protein L484_020386 [Morus notabilis]